METVIRDGLVWPATDEICFDCIKKDIPFLIESLKYCTDRRTAIQAGGNAGMYPVELAEHFNLVMTFEPESLNFSCLEKNTESVTNIKIYNGVLGDSNSPVCIGGWPPNSGSYEVRGQGDIAQFMIDDFNLDDVDFIQLDVQGFEGRVLHGAAQTIKRSHPVIMLEEGYGVTPIALLRELGYQEVAATRPVNKSGIRDAVYVWQ